MTSTKSIYFQIPKIENEGFVVQIDKQDHFFDQLHHHPELQLVYIIKGTGNLFVGDTVTAFEAGNLFLFGSNQSHLLKSDTEYFSDKCEKISESISIFFHEYSLGEKFFKLSETESIQGLIHRADHSLEFSPEVADRIGNRMKELTGIKGFDRFLEILSILDELANTDQYKKLAGVTAENPPTGFESERINNVINYILEHYKEDIKLDVIAEVANYSKAAFCRFFKKRTRKTFSEFLNEVRITEACKLLRNTDLNMSQICYESGFNNISNFNRQFKRITDMTPKQYANRFEDLSADPRTIRYN
ncbi:MAG: helix-turn-helix domain-containing protein [Balneolaceae bacterium]|nr:helix-turn-helix domain-containing protein [Balneolaceae bacterium]